MKLFLFICVFSFFFILGCTQIPLGEAPGGLLPGDDIDEDSIPDDTEDDESPPGPVSSSPVASVIPSCGEADCTGCTDADICTLNLASGNCECFLNTDPCPDEDGIEQMACGQDSAGEDLCCNVDDELCVLKSTGNICRRLDDTGLCDDVDDEFFCAGIPFPNLGTLCCDESESCNAVTIECCSEGTSPTADGCSPDPFCELPGETICNIDTELCCASGTNCLLGDSCMTNDNVGACGNGSGSPACAEGETCVENAEGDVGCCPVGTVYDTENEFTDEEDGGGYPTFDPDPPVNHPFDPNEYCYDICDTTMSAYNPSTGACVPFSACDSGSTPCGNAGAPDFCCGSGIACVPSGSSPVTYTCASP